MLAKHWGLERKAVPENAPIHNSSFIIHTSIWLVHGLKDPRTKDRLFSYTQLELLIARDLGRPIYTFFIQGDDLPTAFAPEPPELAQRQQTFITEFAKDGRNTYGTFSQWDKPADRARGLKQAIEAIKFEITVLAGKPTKRQRKGCPSVIQDCPAPSTAWASSASPPPPSNTPGNTPTTTAPREVVRVQVCSISWRAASSTKLGKTKFAGVEELQKGLVLETTGLRNAEHPEVFFGPLACERSRNLALNSQVANGSFSRIVIPRDVI